MSDKLRLQKHIADSGYCSRRRAEALIKSGRVNVNGRKVTKMGLKIDPDKAIVAIDNKKLEITNEKIYLKLNKPRGVVSSCVSERGEKTIIDLIKKDIEERIYPIGRLDKESEGLILLTNDGELANRLMHPRYEHEKEYEVNVELGIKNDELMRLSSGVKIDGQMTLPAKVVRTGDNSFRITLKEGKKRQIRKMAEMVGNQVVCLKRIRIQNIQLGKLASGQYAPLLPQEKDELLNGLV